jgi:hypothetical protein
LFHLPVLAFSQGLRFIVFADPQITWLTPEVRSIEGAGVRGGLNAGFEMDNFFSDNYAISTGISINSNGGKLRFNEPFRVKFENFSDSLAPGNIMTYKLQYLDIPLGLKFTTREIGYTTIYAKLGFAGHLNIRSRADISALGIEGENLKDEIELFNLSYHFAAGVHYSLGGQTAVVAGLEYRHRFVDIASNRNYKALLNTLSLRVGILF